LSSAISPNERLARLWHPWSSYVIVPLFALANAGIRLDPSFLRDSFTSPITLGIIAGYLVGKPTGINSAVAIVERVTRGRIKAPVGRGALAGASAAAGIGFTVSLLIADRALKGEHLAQAKLGVLTAGVLASLLSAGIFTFIKRQPYKRQLRLLVGRSEQLIDLSQDIDPHEDHIRGPDDAPVTVVEYGDFECPYCGRAEPSVRQLLADVGDDVRYVFRHLPLTDVHPHAQMAAEATEAAGAQGRFWEMHDLLFEHQDALRPSDLVRYAQQLELDVERFRRELRKHEYAGRVARDVESAELSAVSGTPTFFINGQRHHGAYDIASLKAAVRQARARVLVAA
jgi:predicted DsbA family dithiol-disulfide isomerase